MIEDKRETTEEKETGRLEAFSDGVFAVAITLLVFNLKVPQVPVLNNSYTYQIFVRALLDQWPSYLTFFISFTTILIMWLGHNNMFKLIHKSDTLFVFANGLLLMLVTIVPFPTQLVATYLNTPGAAVASAVYAATFIVINLAYTFLWLSAAHQRRLLKANISEVRVRAYTRACLLGFPGYVIALLLAFWNPTVSVSICAFLWIFWILVGYERKTI